MVVLGNFEGRVERRVEEILSTTINHKKQKKKEVAKVDRSKGFEDVFRDI